MRHWKRASLPTPPKKPWSRRETPSLIILQTSRYVGFSRMEKELGTPIARFWAVQDTQKVGVLDPRGTSFELKVCGTIGSLTNFGVSLDEPSTISLFLAAGGGGGGGGINSFFFFLASSMSAFEDVFPLEKMGLECTPPLPSLETPLPLGGSLRSRPTALEESPALAPYFGLSPFGSDLGALGGRLSPRDNPASS